MRTLTQAKIIVIFFCAVSLIQAQTKVTETEQQGYLQPVGRVTSESLIGAAVTADSFVLVNFIPTPNDAYCGDHCASRSILKVRLSVSGTSDQYLLGRYAFNAPMMIRISGKTGLNNPWSAGGNPYTLEASITTDRLSPEQDLVLDVTSFNPARCSGSDSISTSVKVLISSFDTTGIPQAVLDSLVLRAALIEEFSDSPYPSSTISCSGTPMIKTDSAYISNPVTLKWTVGSCPDKFPM